MGRRRIHATEADRQRAYRQRKAVRTAKMEEELRRLAASVRYWRDRANAARHERSR